MEYKTKKEVKSLYTRKEWLELLTNKDKVQSRKETARELGCSTSTLRKIYEELHPESPKRKIGRPVKSTLFKDEI